MKILQSTVIAAAVAGTSVFIQEAGCSTGNLDLPDLFIWGEDRSVTPGLDEYDIFMYPLFSKNAFFKQKGLTEPGKSVLEDQVIRSKKIGGSLAGADPGQYAVSGWIETSDTNKPDYSAQLSGCQGRLSFNEELYRVVDARAGGVYDAGPGALVFSARFHSSDYFTGKDMYRGRVRYQSRAGIIDFQPYLDFAYTDSGEELTYDYSGALEAGIMPVRDNYISLSLAYSDRRMKDASSPGLDISGKYFNDSFRDLSFAVKTGVRTGLIEGVYYEASLAGAAGIFPYSVFIEKNSSVRSFYEVLDEYLFSHTSSFYEPEERFRTGFSLGAVLPGEYLIETGYSFNSYTNRLIVIQKDEGFDPCSYPGKIETSDIYLSLKKGIYYAEYRQETGPEKFHFSGTAVSAGMCPEFSFLGAATAIPVKIEYSSPVQVWSDREGQNYFTAERQYGISLGLNMKYTSGLAVSLTGENLAGGDYYTVFGYPLKGARIMLGVNYSWSNIELKEEE